MPHNGIPPPPDFAQGPFEDAVIMDAPVNNMWDDDPNMNDLFPVGNNKNNKNGKNGKKQQIELYECYILERVKPAAGERLTWSKVVPHRLHFKEDVFIDMAAKNRKRTGRTSIDSQFRALSPNQQKVVTQLIEDRKREETLKNAEWVFFDIYKIEKKGVISKDVTQVQVILHRFDSNLPKGSLAKEGKDGKDGKEGKKGSNEGKKSDYKHPDLIDLNDRSGKKKSNKDKEGNKKAPKKHKSYDDLPDGLGLGLGTNPGHQHRQPSYAPQQDYFPHNMPPPPPDFIPPPPQMQPQFRHPSEVHPFAPMPHVPMAGDYDVPQFHEPDWVHPHQPHRQSARVRTDSFHDERRPSVHRRKSIAAHDDRLRDVEDRLEEMNFRMQNIHVDDSGESYYDDDPEGVWSRPLSPTRSFTPPSSPRSQFSTARQRQSLDRQRSGRYHRKKYRAQSFVEVEPGYPRRRPSLRHANTFDDYPDGGRGEPRYVRAPEPPRVIQRRLTDYPEAYERDREDEYHLRRGSRYGEDMMYEQGGGRRRASRQYWG